MPCVEAQVVNSPYCEELWEEIKAMGKQFCKELTTESLKEMTSIAATRRIYKACGKDPSRYRPASEALIRRILQGKELYQRDTLVDLVNLASIAFGMINIHGLPVYRDAQGGVGTPTSDHERTKMTIDTTHLLVLINGYDGNEQRVRPWGCAVL